MGKKTIAVYKIIYAFVILCMLAMFIWSASNPEEADVRLDKMDITACQDGWTAIGTDGNAIDEVSLPLTRANSHIFAIEKTLSSEDCNERYLFFRTVHTLTKVYVGSELVYIIGDNQKEPFSTPGCGWQFIRLKKEYAGKTFKIVSSSHISRYKGIYSKVYVTDRASALLLIVKNNLVGILTCAMLASLAIILIIVYAFTRKMIKNTKLLDLALFTIILLLWSFGEVQLAQFFIGNMQLLSTVTFESLIILPVPFLWYIRQDERSGISSHTEKLFVLPVLDFVICNLLQTAGLASLDATVTVTHITLLIIVILLVAFEISDIRKSGDGKNDEGEEAKFKISRAGFIVLMLSAVIDITRYYIARSFSDCGIYTRIGLLVYILSLAIETLTGGFRNILEKQKNELLENILYKDQLTGLGNRAACQRKLNEIEKDEKLRENTILSVMDIYGLRKVNCAFGHECGDQLIVMNADYIKRKIGGVAEVYRTGGDEFTAVFCNGDTKRYEIAEKDLLSYKEDKKTVEGIVITFAYGMAKFDRHMDKNVEDTMHRADTLMVKEKAEKMT